MYIFFHFFEEITKQCYPHENIPMTQYLFSQTKTVLSMNLIELHSHFLHSNNFLKFLENLQSVIRPLFVDTDESKYVGVYLFIPME